jgi:hypothetical protein
MQHASRLAAALTTLACTAVPCAHASGTTSPGPYFATPSWDQQLASAARFVVLANWGNQAALDRETGLVWQMSLTQPAPYEQASFACIQSFAGGRMGWRVPTIQELLRTIASGTVTPPGGFYSAAVIADSPFPFLTSYSSPYTLWSSTRTDNAVYPLAAAWLNPDRSVYPVTAMPAGEMPAWCVQSPAPGPSVQ